MLLSPLCDLSFSNLYLCGVCEYCGREEERPLHLYSKKLSLLVVILYFVFGGGGFLFGKEAKLNLKMVKMS